MNKTAPSSIVFTLLLFLLVSPLHVNTVNASPAIFIEPDGSINPTTPLIQRIGDVYTFTSNVPDSIEVRRSNIVIDGAHYTLQGGPGSGIGILLDGLSYGVRNVTVRNLAATDFSQAIALSMSSFNNISGNHITNSSVGIDLDESSHSIISRNIISNCTQGVFIGTSSHNIVSENIITNPVPNPNPSPTYGIWLSAGSHNNTASGNTIANSNFGVHFFYSSLNSVSRNNITNNYNGLYLTSAFDNTILANIIEKSLNGVYFYNLAHNNTLLGNTISTNSYGTYIYNSSDNNIHENNFLNNTKHIYYRNPGYSNTFDLGWPTGGNFWGNYTGVDFNSGPHQNSTGSDGLGDTSHLIDANNTDHYPLISMFSSLQVSSGHSLSVISNSSIESFSYFNENGTIRIRVSNRSSTQSFGFMRVTVPKALIGPPYTVTIDSTETPLNLNDTLYDTVAQRWIYFAYQHSTREISIQGITPDVTPPSINILSPESKRYNARDVPLVFTTSEPALWIGYSLDDQNNITIDGNATIMGLQDGQHSVRVYANDTSGNLGSSEVVTFSVEATPPTIQILSPENKTYNASGMPLTFTVSEPTSWIGYSLDGAMNSSISGNFTISNLLTGKHSVTICANDTSGNMGRSNTIYFTVNITSPDTTPPQILITSPENKTYTTTGDTAAIPLVFVVNEQVTWIAYSLDMRPNVTLIGNTTLAGLSKGRHSIAVYALDAAGNTGASLTIHFSVEAPPPIEPFPAILLILAAIAIIIVAGIAVLIYIRKTKKKA